MSLVAVVEKLFTNEMKNCWTLFQLLLFDGVGMIKLTSSGLEMEHVNVCCLVTPVQFTLTLYTDIKRLIFTK